MSAASAHLELAPASPSAPRSSPARAGRGRRRIWVAVAVAVLLAVASVWLRQDETVVGARLDPTNPGPDGGRAVARVLEDEGVDVRVARSADELSALLDGAADEGAAAAPAVVVTSSAGLAPSTTRRLLEDAGSAPVLLVEPAARTVLRLDPSGTRDPRRVPGGVDGIAASCTGPPPLGGVDLGELRLTVDVATAYDGDGCFAADGGVLLAGLGGAGDAGKESTTPRAWALGAGDALTNDQVLRADNAAVALRLLGGRDRLVWYVPDPTDARADETVTLTSLLPRWLMPSLALLLVAGVALLLWRGRRLGPLSTEPLPVVVRAVETTVSRGRLYRRAGDRGHAAAALRRRARADIADRLGTRSARRQPPAGATDPLLTLTAERTGRPLAEVERLLAGTAPATDAELLRLAHDLQRLTREVR